MSLAAHIEIRPLRDGRWQASVLLPSATLDGLEQAVRDTVEDARAVAMRWCRECWAHGTPVDLIEYDDTRNIALSLREVRSAAHLAAHVERLRAIRRAAEDAAREAAQESRP